MLKNFISVVLLTIFWINNSFAEVATVRVDYYHTGDYQQEMFSLDQVVIEPLAWSGSLNQQIDNLNRGKYRFIVKDKKSAEILFTRSFSSIYGEWETTGEAKQSKRTFHESLRFPKPDRLATIIIEKRDEQHQFKMIWQTDIEPDYYLNHRESGLYKDQVITIEQNGSSEDKVDLLILGDGYSAGEMSAFKETAKKNDGVIIRY